MICISASWLVYCSRTKRRCASLPTLHRLNMCAWIGGLSMQQTSVSFCRFQPLRMALVTMEHGSFLIARLSARSAPLCDEGSSVAGCGWLTAALFRVRFGALFRAAAAAMRGSFARSLQRMMRAIQVARTVALVAPVGVAMLTSGCVTTGSHADRVDVSQVTPELIKRQIVRTDSALDVTATLSTAGIVMNRPGHLVAVIDKRTGGVSYSYIAQLVYSDEAWRYYSSASSSVSNSPRLTPVQVLSRVVAGCSRAVRTYTCTYDERVAVPVDSDAVQFIASLYREGHDVRWLLRFNGSGTPITHEVLPQEAVALQSAVGEFVAQREKGSDAVQPR